MLINFDAKVIIDHQIDHCKEGVRIYSLSLADFVDRAVAETDFNTKASEALQDVVVVSYERKHFVVRLIDFLALHLCS